MVFFLNNFKIKNEKSDLLIPKSKLEKQYFSPDNHSIALNYLATTLSISL